MADVDLYAEVKAHGVMRGMEATADGSKLMVQAGLAYCHGQRIPGGYSVELKPDMPGWWALFAGPTEAKITRDLNSEGLPLWAFLVDDEGKVVVGRDMRRRVLSVQWDGAVTGRCHAVLAAPPRFCVKRVQGATQEVDGAGTPYWSQCVVVANLNLGMVLEPLTWLWMESQRTRPAGLGVVIEGYELG